MSKVKVKIVNKSDNPLPAYQTEGSAGMDVYADIKEQIVIEPLERVVIPTGIFVEIPQGYEIQVRPRSGLAFKHGIMSHFGTIDSDYRGEVKGLLYNLSNEVYIIHPQERIAQFVLSEVPQIEWEPVETLTETERGEGGFGHTGK